MPPAFAEAWDLLMSDVPNDSILLPEGAKLSSPAPPSNISGHAIPASQPAFLQGTASVERDTSQTPVGKSSPLPSVQKNKDMAQSKEIALREQQNPQSLVVLPELQEERSPDVIKRLQNVRRELKLLQDSGFTGDNEDPQAVSAFQKKLELLTEAVLSIAPSAAQPAELRKSSNSSASSSSQNAAPDLRCWDSCCRGRKFSTKSNMIRHRRERLGQVGKCCSICNAYFTRRSVCNAHEANRMCRPTKGSHSY